MSQMTPARPILVNGQPLARGRLPAVCAPLVGRSREALLAEARSVAAKKPDLIEWRADYFAALAQPGRVIDVARALQEAAGGIPLLFTRRSPAEGGEPSGLSPEQVLELYSAVCEARAAQLVDFEIGRPSDEVRRVREAARDTGLILSFHDFAGTPERGFLAGRFSQAEALGADVAKVAVMPQRMEDVLTLLESTLAASSSLRIPVVSMSMGPMGAMTRIFGWAFGSALTFAVGAGSSAPGQIPMEELRHLLELARKASVR